LLERLEPRGCSDCSFAHPFGGVVRRVDESKPKLDDLNAGFVRSRDIGGTVL
jgi:hypothetical protein